MPAIQRPLSHRDEELALDPSLGRADLIIAELFDARTMGLKREGRSFLFDIELMQGYGREEREGKWVKRVRR